MIYWIVSGDFYFLIGFEIFIMKIINSPDLKIDMQSTFIHF